MCQTVYNRRISLQEVASFVNNKDIFRWPFHQAGRHQHTRTVTFKSGARDIKPLDIPGI